MLSILRSVGVVLLGLIVGSLVKVGIEIPSSLMYMPPDFQIMSRAEQAEAIQNLPSQAFLILIASSYVASFVACWIAARLAGCCPRIHVAVVVAIFLFAAILNLKMIPHPDWFWAPELLAYPLMGALAAWVTNKSSK